MCASGRGSVGSGAVLRGRAISSVRLHSNEYCNQSQGYFCCKFITPVTSGSGGGKGGGKKAAVGGFQTAKRRGFALNAWSHQE